MKRKVKKGVKMLTNLIEGAVIYDSKNIMSATNPVIVLNQNTGNRLTGKDGINTANSTLSLEP